MPMEPAGRNARRLFLRAIGAMALAPLGATATPVHAADEIVIAAIADGSRLAEVSAGVAAAIERANRDGGVLGARLRLISLDDRCAAKDGELAAGQAIARGATLVVGHLCSSAAIAAAPVYARHGIVMITTGARNPRLTDKRAGATIFRLAGRDDRFGAEVADYIAGLREPRVALVHDKTLQARTLAGEIDRELERNGIRPAVREAYVAGEREYNTIAARILAERADIVILPAQPIEAGIIMARLEEIGSRPLFIASDILAVPEIEATARRFGDRFQVWLAEPWPPEARSHAGGAGVGPGHARRASEAAVDIWVEAGRRAGSLDGPVVAREISAGSPPTAAGASARFDAKGDARLRSFAPHVWRDGGWQPLVRQTAQP